MPASPLPDLDTREVISLDAAEALLAEVRREIAQLEADIRRAERSAEEAESRAESNSLTSPFGLQSLATTSEFVAVMHARNREELQQAYEDAEAEARNRVQLAEAEADSILAAARSDVAVVVEDDVVDLTDTVDAEPPAAAVEVDEPSDSQDELLGSEEAYEKFWREEQEVAKTRGASFAPIEALLPVIALVVVLCVVLILVG